MNVLVTGGAGYIGSHTAKLLVRSGFQPVVLDNLSRGECRAVRWGPLVEGDLANGKLLRDVLRHHRIEAVMHFAAYAEVGDSVRDPRKYFKNNLGGTLALLGAMLDTGVKTIVFSSTCATYGVPETVPIAESHPQHPVNPYGESKYCCERALDWYGSAYKMGWVALRYFNAAGADPDGSLGENHELSARLIPMVLNASTGRIPYAEIYGMDYPTPDGTAIRDYVHVSDLAEAHVLALRYLLDGGRSTALNLGSGRGYSVREVIATVEQLAGHGINTRIGPRREGDPPALVADASLAASLLGWKPRYSDLDTIIGTALAWHRSHQSR